jgi:hypothetical protein
MRNKIITIALLACLSAWAWADNPAIKPDHPDQYIVQKGDTLWGITGRFLEQPWRWPEVWQANPQIANPHLIYPGDVVRLSYQDGRPILTVERGTGPAAGARGAAGGRDVKLSPQIRVEERVEAIPTIPIDVIRPFLSRPLVVQAEEMEELPYVVSSLDQHLVAGPGHKIYIRGLPEGHGSRYSLYRRGTAYRQTPGPEQVAESRYSDRSKMVMTLSDQTKDGDDVLGYQALYVGDIVVLESGDPATALITHAEREVQTGDRLFTITEQDVASDFVPRPPAKEVSGQILAVVDGVSEIGQYQVVVLNVGSDDGIEVGNVLGVYQSGEIVNDKIAKIIREKELDRQRLVLAHEDKSAVDRLLSNIFNDIRDTKRAFDKHMDYFGRPQPPDEPVRLPEEYRGVVMVFRTFDRMSYALVMDITGPLHLYDAVRSL